VPQAKSVPQDVANFGIGTLGLTNMKV
jgi:hypothetical protein